MHFGDVQRLRAFALVLDLGSISAAAGVLGYTQSAVSQQLAALEREAGAALVDRSQRPLRATRAGAILRPHVERVLAALGGAEAAIEDVRGATLRLAWPPSPAPCRRSCPPRCVTCVAPTPSSSSESSSSRRARRSSISAGGGGPRGRTSHARSARTRDGGPDAATPARR